MRRLPCGMCGLLVVLVCTGAQAIQIGTKKWTVTPAGANAYYLNNNLDGGGVLVGQISFGARHFDVDGNELHSLATAGLFSNNGAKSLVRIGNYYYISHANAGGIGRFDATGADAWNSTSFVAPLNPGGIGPESLVTDGTYLYTNDDATRNRIHAYSVSDPFGLTEAWSVDLPTGGRVRGLTYDAGSGFLYMHNGGADGVTYNDLYAVDVSAQQAYLMGEHSEELVYEVLRYGDELLVFGKSDKMTVYSLLSDTTIGAMTQQIDLGVGDIYGAAIYGDTLFVSSFGSQVSAFSIIPEPASLLLMASGALGLLWWGRRRLTRLSTRRR